MRAILTTRILVIATAIAAVGVGILATEVILEVRQYRGNIAIRRAVAERNGRPLDLRSIPAIIQQSQQTDVPLVPSVTPNVVLSHAQPGTDPSVAYTADILPVGGLSRRTTLQSCNEDGRFHAYVADRYGFANPDTAWAGNHPELVLVGDSFMHGYCVTPDSAVASLLRQTRPRTVTVGTGGSGPLAQLAALTEYAVPTAAPTVLWVYFENDLGDLASERNEPRLKPYLDSSFHQHLIEKQPAIDSVLSNWTERVASRGLTRDFLLDPPNLRRILSLRMLRAALGRSRQPSLDRRTQLPLFRDILRTAASRVSAYGGHLAFVFLPAWDRYYESSTLVADGARAEVLAAAREAGLPIIDLAPAFASHARREALFAKGKIAPAHYSPDGYALTAAAIARGLDSLHIEHK